LTNIKDFAIITTVLNFKEDEMQQIPLWAWILFGSMALFAITSLCDALQSWAESRGRMKIITRCCCGKHNDEEEIDA
jgi:hypothetical protein